MFHVDHNLLRVRVRIPRFAEDLAEIFHDSMMVHDSMISIDCMMAHDCLMDHDCMMVQVTISSSQSGKQATARAIVQETGHLVGIRIPQGCEYRHGDIVLWLTYVRYMVIACAIDIMKSLLR